MGAATWGGVEESAAAGGRRPGRPRDVTIGPRVLAAASALFGEVGYEGGSIAAISERSGVGKPSIYLRWRNRHELFVACVRALGPLPPPPVPAATLAGDLTAWAEDASEALTGRERRLVRAALFSALTDLEVATALDETLLAPIRERLAAVLGRWPEAAAAGDRGTPAAVASALLAPLVHAVAIGRPTVDARTAAELVARSLAHEAGAARS
ncbi:MAG TPA: TetR/AcrR family transcriptional regulator [Miltoncostaea sp.]|nr:TetR/AcrR family transcriptional regulator [Miltoncostaea sp.]